MGQTDKTPNPISSFIASILHLIFIIIVIKVILLYAENRDTNISKAIGKEAKGIYKDFKNGWTNENDTVK